MILDQLTVDSVIIDVLHAPRVRAVLNATREQEDHYQHHHVVVMLGTMMMVQI
jgi:hypothetical protein